MIGHAAHRDLIPLGQGEVKQPGGDLGVLKKELVKISQPKEEQGISRHARAQPLILLHHRGESMSHGERMKPEEGKCQLQIVPGKKKPGTLFPRCRA